LTDTNVQFRASPEERKSSKRGVINVVDLPTKGIVSGDYMLPNVPVERRAIPSGEHQNFTLFAKS